MENKLNIKNTKVLYDNLIILPWKENEELSSGLILSTSYEEKPQLGEVIKIGEGRLLDNGTLVPLKVKVGDVILFNKYSSTEFVIDNVKYLILREEDIIAIF